MIYKYGEEVEYEISKITPEDKKDLLAFSCGNIKLDHFFHEELINNGEVNDDDGLPFKVVDKKIIK